MKTDGSDTPERGSMGSAWKLPNSPAPAAPMSSAISMPSPRLK